jgi:hypothetical protein
MFHFVFHNGQAPGNSGYGRALAHAWAGHRAIIVQVFRAWAGCVRARLSLASSHTNCGLRLIGAGAVAAAAAVADADGAAGAAHQVTTGDDPDRIVRDAQQQIYTGLGGSPGNQGTPGDQPTPDDCLDHGPEAVTGPSTSGDVLGMGEEDRYSRCTWARCSGDCRCGLADDIPERTAPSDPADCCVVSDPFELCTWGACYDECTCRPSSPSQEPLAVTTEIPAPVARWF